MSTIFLPVTRLKWALEGKDFTVKQCNNCGPMYVSKDNVTVGEFHRDGLHVVYHARFSDIGASAEAEKIARNYATIA